MPLECIFVFRYAVRRYGCAFSPNVCGRCGAGLETRTHPTSHASNNTPWNMFSNCSGELPTFLPFITWFEMILIRRPDHCSHVLTISTVDCSNSCDHDCGTASDVMYVCLFTSCRFVCILIFAQRAQALLDENFLVAHSFGTYSNILFERGRQREFSGEIKHQQTKAEIIGGKVFAGGAIIITAAATVAQNENNSTIHMLRFRSIWASR